MVDGVGWGSLWPTLLPPGADGQAYGGAGYDVDDVGDCKDEQS